MKWISNFCKDEMEKPFEKATITKQRKKKLKVMEIMLLSNKL